VPWRGGDGERIAVELVEADLVGAGPVLIPGDIDLMHHLLGVPGVGAGIGDHAAVELDSLGLGRHHIGRRRAIVPGDDRVHAAVGQIAYVATRPVAKLVVALAGRFVPARTNCNSIRVCRSAGTGETGRLATLRYNDALATGFRHLDHGYAVTSYSSQSQTVDRVLINADANESDLGE